MGFGLGSSHEWLGSSQIDSTAVDRSPPEVHHTRESSIRTARSHQQGVEPMTNPKPTSVFRTVDPRYGLITVRRFASSAHGACRPRRWDLDSDVRALLQGVN
jgi:hypothetical protein